MKRVLIVDDQADLRRLVRWSLEMLEDGVELHEANGSAAALRMAESIKPDLVLLDVMMPGPMNGLEVCRQLRAMPDLSHTKIVLVSARGQINDVREGVAAGANSYIVKPFSPQKLLDTVESMFTKADSSKEPS
ncbi:response regulator transcription factor [Piscinibacter terrae]|uniref:Response regulator n=1 Tax=Piscinibacter terrae TaxID=2496871 RepID=A0A3N7HIQ3_9BURK|nr:response regulator [Albitalea terrae]RQP21920.1 response regulator [Albitalea terrae]